MRLLLSAADNGAVRGVWVFARREMPPRHNSAHCCVTVMRASPLRSPVVYCSGRPPPCSAVVSPVIILYYIILYYIIYHYI